MNLDTTKAREIVLSRLQSGPQTGRGLRQALETSPGIPREAALILVVLVLRELTQSGKVLCTHHGLSARDTRYRLA